MRGGLERWKRGVDSRGVRQAIGYALEGTCDARLQHSPGVDALEAYSAASDSTVSRFIVENGVITSDELTAGGLRVWLTGHDPITGEERGRQRLSPDADLLLDGTLNHPKSYSIAALLHPELAAEFEALQDRLRDRILLTWQTELNARRGHGGLIREEITRIEVVELQHRRSRALDPHIHRHLWLNIKVLGADGKWSNLDSRVAMKLHTVVNAEGELAARTDPTWIAALARHGYTLDDTGEIAELAGAVRPVSRRSAQIEANRARLIAEWSATHGGSAPSVEVLQQIDRLAWAVSRPNKPADLDEASWETRVRDEIAAIDPNLTNPRAPVPVRATDINAVDLDLLAAQAVVDADERSTSCGGRFSSFDVRAGAIRALSRTGVVAERNRLDGVIAEITERATRSVFQLVAEPPAHVKAFMATETVRAKVRLAGRLDVLARPGRSLLPGELHRHAPNADLSALDASQSVAACAIAGTDGLVTVTGPAGAGKTTMLRSAFAALTSQRRRMLVVAPTRKAASVASREVGAAASSIHALLLDHGYRWGTDQAGAKVWTRLRVGDVDPSTGAVYGGPTQYVLRSRDRIVVDEAGMVDLQTANVLVELAIEQGVGLAFVGDTHQALPVGHAGAMGSAIRHANAAVELDTVHRFRDPDYAALTLRLRDAGDRERALVVAGELAEHGHVDRVEHHDAARERMIDAYFDWHARGKRVTLVSGTNAEADAINDAIQQRRVDQGELGVHVVAWGMAQQRILVGDTVQTRRNDRLTGVENRAQWIVRGIRDEYLSLVSVSDSGEVARVSTEYAREHLQLAYASTVHGVQGDTADASVVGPDVDAAGLYVGLTRGRVHNVAIVVARTDAAARECLAESMGRGTPELTMQDAARAAQAEMRRAARNREETMATGPVVGAPGAGRGIGK
ncbi:MULTISPECIES: AAA family ATPase [Microbacterium]|uniref:AAA family ATPase n=1 Tax=Microbacterium TaxID=33882 RepID=UPI000D64AFE5|nr:MULTISPECIES: AAA family ATPase [Microbacterium]